MSEWRLCIRGLLAAAIVACVASEAPAAFDTGGAPAVQFVTSEQVLPLGRDRIIPVRVSEAAAEDRELGVSSTDDRVVRVVAPVRVLAGQAIGYAIVRPLQEGAATLRTGESSLEIRVVSRPSLIDDRFAPPTIEGPANGAAVWGKVSVGVSYWAVSPREADEQTAAGVWLCVQGLDELRPVRTTTADDGPLVHACFEFDASELPSGPVRLVARVVDADGRERFSLPTVVRIVHPESNNLASGECEDDNGIDEPNPYDQRQTSSRGAVRRDPRASGGQYFSNASTYPRFGFPVELERAGWYQLAVVAGGDLSMGTLPSVGVVVDPGAATEDRPVTSGPIIATGWHRMSLGTPFRLDAGRHTIRLHFLNDFYAGNGADRNLQLDRWELLRVADASDAARPTAASEGGMMGMQAMSAGGGQMMAAGGADMMMSGAAAGGLGPAEGAWPASVAAMNSTGEGPLRVAFVETTDVLHMPGEVELRGAVWQSASDRANAAAPRVGLMINGVEIASQYTFTPRFRVRPDQLHAGVNTVELTAIDARGTTARSPVQRVMWRGFERASVQTAANAYHRFTLHDPAWSDNAISLRSGEKNPDERSSAGMYSNTTLALELPVELEGEFLLEAEAIGQNFEGPAVLEFAVVEDDGEFDAAAPRPPAAGVLRVPTTWWGPHEVELKQPLKLARGPKRLLVSFVNDRYEEGKGDRNVWLAAVSLVAAAGDTGRVVPRVDVSYPHNNDIVSMVYGQGAVIVEPSNARLVRKIELLIDGEPTGLSMDIGRRCGPFVLQYPADGLSPGKHVLSVRAWDQEWRTADSVGREIEVLAQRPESPTEYERAIVLLDRFGFGASQRDLAAILVEGPDAYLQQSLCAPLDTDAERSALALASIRFPNPRGEYDVVRRVLAHALVTPNPVRARFVLWTQNHFSTYIRKTEGRRKAEEHEAFAALGAAPFAELLRTSARSPAMLRYLDQERSFARRINENYAREIMELHTLGVHGGYSQADVTALACILTGWSTSGHVPGRVAPGGEGVAAERFRFDPRLSDPREQRVLGFGFPETPVRDRYVRADFALELLAAHPSTATFVCRKLAEHYCCVPAPEDLVKDLASTFTRTSGDMQAVLLEMSRHPAFWREARRPRIAHPLDFGIRMARIVGEANAHAVGEFLQSSGFGLFERATPDGYPEEDAAAMSSNAMLQRWRFARRAEWQLAALVPGELRYVGKDREAPADDEARRIIDLVALRLTGRVLSERSFTAARDVLSGTSGDRDERVRAVATFIAQLPEAGVK